VKTSNRLGRRQYATSITTATRASIQGQAYAEYVVILVVVILLLIAEGDNSAMNQLIAAFKSFYQSYSYAIAVP